MGETRLSVREILAGRAPQGETVTVKGWVRTRRDSKAGISFVNVSDGVGVGVVIGGEVVVDGGRHVRIDVAAALTESIAAVRDMAEGS